MSDSNKILTVKCPGCHRKIFKYKKIGKGHLLRCWKSKIIKDESIQENGKIKCTCGMIIGIDMGKYIKMKRVVEV